jgi:hypothetical protein
LRPDEAQSGTKPTQSNMRSKEQKRTTFYISTLTLIIVIICAVYVIRADQHVARATVVFENRTIENARVDWRFSNDIQVSEPSGAVHILPDDAIISYESNQWHLGMFAWGAIVIVLICGVLAVAGPLLQISKAWSRNGNFS